MDCENNKSSFRKIYKFSDTIDDKIERIRNWILVDISLCRSIYKFRYYNLIEEYDCSCYKDKIINYYNLLIQDHIYRGVMNKIISILSIYLNDPLSSMVSFVKYVWFHDDTIKRSCIFKTISRIHKNNGIDVIGRLTKSAIVNN